MLQIINVWFGILIMGICEVLFAKIILQENIKVSKLKLCLTIVASSIIYTCNNILLYGTIKTIVVCLVHIIVFKYIFKIKWSKCILLTIIYLILMIFLDLFELFFVSKILKMDIEFLYTNYAGSIIGNITVSLLFIVLTYSLKKYLRIIIKSKINNNLKIIILSIMTVICVLAFFYTLIREFRFSDNILLYLISMLVLISILIVLIKQTVENNKLTSEYDRLLEFMTTYETEIERQRVLRHETKNEFLTIRGKIHDKVKDKEIVEYIDGILKEKIEVKQEEYAKFGYLPPNGLKGLCYLKIQEAQDQNITTSINISKRINNSNIYKLNKEEQRNLGKILGIILDNAIESAKKSKDKRIGFESYLVKNECQIIISNSYCESININKIGKEKFSTKGKNRGHGLLLVKHIINKSKCLDVKTSVTDKLFIQTIIIK